VHSTRHTKSGTPTIQAIQCAWHSDLPVTTEDSLWTLPTCLAPVNPNNNRMNYPHIEWCQKIKQVCDALAQKHLKLAREYCKHTALINALKKMGTKPTPGLKLRQSLKDVGRLGISWTSQKKEPQMRSKQQSVMPTKLGTCAQKQGKKNKQEGCRWCPGMLSQPSKITKKPLGGQMKLAAVTVPRDRGSK
jgi:hypothetical protein